MGVMRFLVQPPEVAQHWSSGESAYITGVDGRVYPMRLSLEDGMLTCTRSSSDSGKLHVPWPVEGFGEPVITTASLPEHERPYLLPLELARGLIGSLRDQSFHWQLAGMTIPQEFDELMRDAFGRFAKASGCRSDLERCGRFAQEALIPACAAADVLGKSYTEQRLRSRKLSSAHPPALLGCTLDSSLQNDANKEIFCDLFSSAVVPVEWARIEQEEGQYQWEELDQLVECCQKQRMIIRGGPLIDLSPGGMPAWLAPWASDFLNLQSFVCDFVETAVTRYVGPIRIWEVSTRANTGGGLNLSEEQRLALVARTLEAAKRADADCQTFIRIDRPWGEYQASGNFRLTPFQFVDALVRSSLGLSGVNLEIAVGYEPIGTRRRDLLAVSKLIDLWSLLGIQIHVTLAFPSSLEADPLASSNVSVVQSKSEQPWTEAFQAQLIDQYIGLLVSKPNVTGVFWSHFSDSAPHCFPHAGILRADETPKLACEVLRSIQQNRIRPGRDSMESDGSWNEP